MRQEEWTVEAADAYLNEIPKFTSEKHTAESLMGNAFLVERIFNWPGISRYGINAMLFKDLNAICAVVLIIGITFFVVNLVVDLIVAALDPRMRKGGSK